MLHNKLQCPAFLLVDIGHSRIESQHVASECHAVVFEGLLGMEDAAEIETHDILDDCLWIAAFAFQAQQESRGYRQRPIAGRPGRRFIEVDWIGFANGLGEKPQATFFHFGGSDAKRTADQILVCHFN
ncbi:hypothetical protein D3C81_1902260 [compost metagenome]